MISQMACTAFPNLIDLCVSDFDVEQESALYGKRILFVMGGSEANLAFYEHVYALGINLVVLDRHGHWAKAYVEQGLFEAFIEVPPTDGSGCTYDDVLYALFDSELFFDGVATVEDDATLLAVRLACVMGLPRYPISAISSSPDKYRLVQNLPEARGCGYPVRTAIPHLA